MTGLSFRPVHVALMFVCSNTKRLRWQRNEPVKQEGSVTSAWMNFVETQGHPTCSAATISIKHGIHTQLFTTMTTHAIFYNVQ